MSSFHAYPSSCFSYTCYDRTTPLKADVVEFDTTGRFSTTEYSYTAADTEYWQFNFNMLWESPASGGYLTPCLFIKRSGWAIWKELCGTDITIAVGGQNQGLCLSRIVRLQAGDKIRAHPCFAWGSPTTQARLANAVSGDGINTCNYFEGHQIS